MRFIIFIIVLLLLTFYLGLKINLLLSGKRLISALIALTLLAISVSWLFLYRNNPTLLESSWFKVLLAAGNITMGFLGAFIVFSLIFDVIYFAFAMWGKLFPSALESFDEERRGLFRKFGSLSLVGISGLIAGAGYRTAKYGLMTKKVTIPIENLPEDLKKLKLIQISDLHIGLTIDAHYVEKVADLAMQARADIIVITGDLVDGSPESLFERWQPLKKLSAPLGVFFITGNHEYYSGVESWLEVMSELGAIPLINENRIISHAGYQILISGVTDPTGAEFLESHKPDIAQARGNHQESVLKILLAHRPETCLDAEPHGFDLQLSGHTHAGQFFPFNLIVMFAHKYYKGLNRHGKMWVYVNQGTGYWGPANRFALPSEITEISFVPTIEPA